MHALFGLSPLCCLSTSRCHHVILSFTPGPVSNPWLILVLEARRLTGIANPAALYHTVMSLLRDSVVFAWSKAFLFGFISAAQPLVGVWLSTRNGSSLGGGNEWDGICDELDVYSPVCHSLSSDLIACEGDSVCSYARSGAAELLLCVHNLHSGRMVQWGTCASLPRTSWSLR